MRVCNKNLTTGPDLENMIKSNIDEGIPDSHF